MTDDFRETYQREVRRLAALRAETPPRRSLRQRITDLLAREPHPKPQRISGPRLMTDWHEEAVNQTLPLAGQRCLNRDCRAVMLPGSDPLHSLAGLCGKCYAHAQGNPAPPRTAETDEGPRAA